jgi:hypothetical protein
MALEFIWMGQCFLNLADHRAQRKAGRESALAMVGERRGDTMKCRRRLLAVIFVITFVGVAYGELKLRSIHPDEPVEYTYEKRFSLEMALSSLRKIQASLESFRTLTDEAKGKISGERLKEIGNTDWETQHLGFKNMPGCIEGVLRKQDYLIKELRYQLAREKLSQKAITEGELLETRRAFEEAEKSFQAFWDSFGVAD